MNALITRVFLNLPYYTPSHQPGRPPAPPPPAPRRNPWVPAPWVRDPTNARPHGFATPWVRDPMGSRPNGFATQWVRGSMGPRLHGFATSLFRDPLFRAPTNPDPTNLSLALIKKIELFQ